MKESFQKALSEKLKDIEINSTDISWELLRNTITETCSTELGKQERVHEDWFDENDKEINALFALKRKAFISWHQEYRNRQKREHYHSIRSIVQNKIRGMKNNWWSRKSEELQRLADMNNSKEFFAATPSCMAQGLAVLDQLLQRMAPLYTRRKLRSERDGVNISRNCLTRMLRLMKMQ